MRVGLTITCLLLLWDVATCHGDEPQRTNRKAVQDVLWEASEIALKQDEHQQVWSELVLLHIGDAQIRAGDFEGALKSIRGSAHPFGRNAALLNLAKALARDGKRERAFEILHPFESDRAWRREYLDDVNLSWIEHLIASGDLDSARKAIEQLKSEPRRPVGLRKLAVAYAKSGDAARAAELFTLAVDTAATLTKELDRAQALCEIADAQLAVGSVDAAKATIRRLVGTAEPKEPWAKVTALRQSAVLAVKANDEATARSLFRRAIKALQTVDARNKIDVLKLIAVDQAGVGFIDDAFRTASVIKQSAEDIFQDGDREEVLLAIAIARLRINDVEGAVGTALSVKTFVQYRDDALHKVVDHQIAKRDLKAALTTAERVDNTSRKAAAILKVATARAKSGDRKSAVNVAARIELAHRDWPLGTGGKGRFDYRLPRTWGVDYQASPSFTVASYHMANRDAAGVAAAAMALAQALGQKSTQSYADLFNEIRSEKVMLALARAHAASGHSSDAMAWAKQIGSSEKVNSKNDHDASWAVQRRIHALVGVAEGILDLSREMLPGTAR